MAQKDKVKELVGRGLNSYHTKSLQQMERIEKKNKEQNHKISILSNELDNDYLTKTEEGSVISLEHSKEGMVYLDELQGNTLVNYCTDGSKEITLNGDIDLEGTFVTTTEGVDNGKVDVMCEGNTLVNKYFQPESNSYLANNKIVFAHQKGYIFNTKHCFDVRGWSRIITVISTTNKPVYLEWLSDNGTSVSWGGLLNNEILKSKIELPSNCSSISIGGYTSNGWTVENAQQANILILEGDWTNKEIPQYFEGMKSVGECEDSKIEILSKNKNLFELNKLDNYVENYGVINNVSFDNGITFKNLSNGNHIKSKPFKIDKGKTYQVSFDIEAHSKSKPWLGIYKDDNTYWGAYYTAEENSNNRYKFSFTSDKDYYIANFRIYSYNVDGINPNFTIKNIQIELDTQTNYVPHKLNKKEISLNKPLRGLPNGVCDKFVKQGGNWYVERNCGEIVFNGSEGSWMASSTNGNVATSLFYIKQSDRLAQSIGLCDRFSTLSGYGTNEPEGVFYGIDINIRINVNKLKTNNLEGFKEWLQQNPTTIVYQLATPTYEEITDPQVITYLDTTHISNNSTIPCNMQTKNSGYNTIIKPSTQYTVALDTNKSGTIGINLGGAKGTTTNNVLKLTTPATLTDDSLRLYGKGIKGSKVRLLEGDKTNWIPSHFEGMKSSFEDKVQDDGSYKMEILSEDKNKLNGYNFARNIFNSVKNSVLDTENKTIKYNASDIDNVILKSIKFKKNTRYTIILKGFNSNEDMQATNINVIYTDGSSQPINNFIDGISVVVTFEGKTVSHLIGNWSTLTTTLYYDECGIFEGVNVPFEPYKYHNKIQFLLDEPLRKIDNILKDKFTFKDGKLMIERNCIEKTLDGSETWHNDGEVKNGYLCCYINNTTTNMSNHSKRTFKCNILPYEETKRFNYEQATRSGAGFLEFILKVNTIAEFRQKISELRPTVIVGLSEPTYEEIPFELQKIILEGYENGTLFFDTNIPPTSTVTYAGETPIVKATKLNKTEVLNNTNDINDNIIPYLMDMDYRVVCLQLQSENINDGVSMARLFGGAYEMLQRDIQSRRYSIDEYKSRLDAYLDANKITEEEYNKLGDMLNE